MPEIAYFRESDPYETYDAGDEIFLVGDSDDVMYYVVAGEVELRFAGTVLEVVTKNGIIGEKTLIDNVPHTTSAIAKTECKIVTITSKQFFFMVHETPMFAFMVLRTMTATHPQNYGVGTPPT